MWVPRSTPKPSPDPSRNGARVSSGTRVGETTGTEGVATTTSVLAGITMTAVAGTMTMTADGTTAEVARQNTPSGRRGCSLFRQYSQHPVDLVTESEAARVRIGLGGVEAIRHIRVADSVFQVDKTE